MPEGVKTVSGSGLTAHYQVTDSMDLTDTGIEWKIPDERVLELTDVKAEYEIEDDWADDEDIWWMEYYRKNGPELPDVIDMDVYTHLKE